MFDLSTEFGARVARRLDKELIIWLVTVRAEQNPKVALNFDGDGDGGDIIVFTGTAAIDPQAPPSNEIAAYQEKYGEHIVGINMTPELFARAYSVALRVTPASVRGH
jgi:PPOX class probable F420-dependent enzyme